MSSDPNSPRTVLPLRRGVRRSDPAAYEQAAGLVLKMVEQLTTIRGVEAQVLVQRAAEALDRFDADLERAGVQPSTIRPARYVLGLMLDQAVRKNRGVDVALWGAGAHRLIFDGRDISAASVREFIRKADEAGPDFEGVKVFLERRLAVLEGSRTTFDRNLGAGWTGITLVLILAFVLLVAGWAGFGEWRFHRDLTRLFDAEALDIGLDRDAVMPDLPQRLTRLAAASDGVERAAEKAPIQLFARLLGFDAAAHADAVYSAAVQKHMPSALARAVDAALAAEGESLPLYDTLRAWSVLSGQADWSPAYLAGWLDDRAASMPDLQPLVPHIRRLLPPSQSVPLPDPELLAQARTFASEAPEPARAYLELKRSAGAAELAPWIPEAAVPGLSVVLQRRSGVVMETALPGLFTQGGWDYARQVGAGLAVQNARGEAARLFDRVAPGQNDAPDQVLDILQRETLARWKEFLADVQVRPFSDPEQAVLVSGRLAAPDSPLSRLLPEVWAQVGGLDRARPHAMQLRIASDFAALIQYSEDGRMEEIAKLFASLNVALGAMDRDEARGLQRLMSAKSRGATLAALRTAPAMVVQIVEDVLAQSSAAQADPLSNPLTKAWQAEVLSLCKDVTEARYPFAEGAEASLSEVVSLLGSGGALDRFYRTRAEPYIDTSSSPWRWKPDARFSGLDPKSAEFLQRTQAIAAGFTGQSTDLTLAALAERGKTFVAIGGQGGPVETTLEPLTLTWPGPAPALGAEMRFTTADGSATLAQTGEWGLLRILDGIRLRERDGGKRFLVDLRSGGARLFMEVQFQAEANPVSRWALLKGLACPTAL
ncbi:ImcF-related family protein [Tabrizicola sp.]|uniref:ImcF-related family protein n=1 Tax=Tabrizicola sp. TaxID=2005166 RepID=UPI002732CAD7|nr:ImcF-related family protein [Tabrizicola sp.]MDP3195631.1 ImcF-related family protein [Tabrizicola sp.]